MPRGMSAGVSDPLPGETIPAPEASHATDSLVEAIERRRASRDTPLVRRMNLLWLAFIVLMLAGGIATATGDQPDLWRSWRGPAMALLALAFVGWYFLVGVALRRHAGWPLPRGRIYAYLCVGLVLVAALLTFSIGFADLFFALIGMTAALLPFRHSMLPVGALMLMYVGVNALLSPHGAWSSDLAGQVLSLVLSVGTIYALTALVHERFEREHLIDELGEAHRRLRLAAARDADLATLRERNRLAREMHDSLGHALVSVSIKLDAVRLLYDVDPARGAAELDEAAALVRSTMTELRQSIAGLRPAALDEQPIGAALAAMTHEMGRRTHAAATCAVDEGAALLDRDTQEALYRVGQEALTNVAKHAHASHVAVALTVGNQRAVLEVADDGVGLGAAQRTGSHYGVRGMRERVEALGGTLTLGPAARGGTVLRALVPLGGPE